MKVLYINAMFQLPDDFEGTRDDALNLMLEYRQREDAQANRQRTDATPLSDDQMHILNLSAKVIWGNAVQDFANGFRISGAITLTDTKK